ncbi:MAG TPA: VWA domain-containing protein [Candidatus Eisenbacteria bacterium]|nr:VWA domain-containing protein [Candidatus Eisenbacteria bacterium]
MRFDYSKWKGPRPEDLEFIRQLMEIYRNLLLQTGGDVDEALRWMEHFGEQYGFFNEGFGVADFKKLLEQTGEVERTPQGFKVTPKGERRIRQDSLNEIFSTLQAGGAGEHRTPVAGRGGERLSETRPYRFGDNLSDLDPLGSVSNAVRNRGVDDLSLTEDDLQVYESEHLSACATVLMVDISHSMILYGEDRITPAKKIALALSQLIQTRYPRDTLDVVLFGDDAIRVKLNDLMKIQAGPYHTNTKAGLQLAQRVLASRKGVNKQIFMITDGKPSAIREHGRLYKNPFGLDPKIVNKTLEEAAYCRRKGVTITTFMLATDYPLLDFVRKLTALNHGRIYETDPNNIGAYVFRDFVRNRRKRLH